MFYPESPDELAQMVDRFLAEATAGQPGTKPVPKAVIVPHAGYIYSGSTAAQAFARFTPAADRITRVVLFGPSHRVALRGLALPEVDAFRTPLGDIPTGRAEVTGLPQVVTSDAVHAPEHSLEVQLPFLQRVLGNFELVPLVVGQATAEEVAAVVDRLWGGPETALVFSSDLSHYHPYAEAQRLDSETVDRMLQLAGPIDPERACGAKPVNGLLLSASQRHLGTELLGLCNSGDTAGDKSRVVGYCAIGVG
jgi:MEMO1 family protein